MMVNFKQAGIHHIEGANGSRVTLLPGLNSVEEADLSEAMKLPAFKGMVDDGLIEVLLPKKEEDEVNFARMPEREVLDLVKATVKKEMLEEMLAGEKRSKVIAAIKAQLVAIDPTK